MLQWNNGELRDSRVPADEIFYGEGLSVSYTLKTDDITTGEKLRFQPYTDRKELFTVEGNRLYAPKTKTSLSVEPFRDGLRFTGKSESDALSQFGVGLPMNFMGKMNAGGWENQFLFNTTVNLPELGLHYMYLTKVNGADLLIVLMGEADGWRMDYSPFCHGHYFHYLKLLPCFDRAYKTSPKKQEITFLMLPVDSFADALTKMADICGVPFLQSHCNGGRLGRHLHLTPYGKCDALEITDKKGTRVVPFDEDFVLTEEGETSIRPLFGDKRGAPCTVYGFEDLGLLYRKSMDTVDLDVVATLDGNLAENQCWSMAMVRYLLRYGKDLDEGRRKEYEAKLKQLLDRVTETDPAKATPFQTILATPHEDYPAYHLFQSNRIQDTFFGVSLLMDSYRYFGEELYYDYAVKTMDSLMNFYLRDGMLARPHGDRIRDYTTVCSPMLQIVDMALFCRERDPERSAYYTKCAEQMAEFLCNRGMSFPTEGHISQEVEAEVEDGSMSCTALGLLYFCAHIRRDERYIAMAKKVLDVHETWMMKGPLCQMHESSLRWWEYIWEGDKDGPGICMAHPWTIWRSEADYWLAVVTNDRERLLRAWNGYMTNLSKIREDGHSFSFHYVDLIPGGGGYNKSADEVVFRVCHGFPDQVDCSISRYVWFRMPEGFLDGDMAE